jgi:prevent-host-death family protein
MKSEQPEQVGVRALRENLSSLLDRVKEGETLEVTEHGRPVARISPIGPDEDPLRRMAAEGRLITAKASIAEVLRDRATPEPEIARSVLQALREQREDKI